MIGILINPFLVANIDAMKKEMPGTARKPLTNKENLSTVLFIIQPIKTRERKIIIAKAIIFKNIISNL